VSSSVHLQPWPQADPALVKVETTPWWSGQRQGPARLEVSPEISEADALAAALADPSIRQALGERSAQRVVVAHRA